MCARTPFLSRSVRLSNGVALGMAKNQVLEVLGVPAEQNASELLYRWSYRRGVTEEERAKLVVVVGPDYAARSHEFIGQALLSVKLRDGRVQSISVARIEEPV